MDKPIPEAVELLRAFQSQFGARRPDEDEDDAETWDRIDAVCKALTAAQQQGQPTPPSAPVGVEELVKLLERIRDLLASLPADCLGSGTDASGQPYPIRDEVIHGITKALAQQPAAVDGAVLP